MSNSINQMEKKVLGYSEFTSKKGVAYMVLHTVGRDARVQGMSVEQIIVARDCVDVQTTEGNIFGSDVYCKPIYNRTGYCMECTLYCHD